MTSAIDCFLSDSANMSQAFLTTKQPVGKISTANNDRVLMSHALIKP